MKNILVVDDDYHTLNTLGELLNDMGYCVTLAAGPTKALELFSEISFDLVLCDLFLIEDRLGVFSMTVGMDFISAVSSQFPQIPIVAISGNLPDNPKSTLEKFGAVNVLHKPFGHDELLRAVKETGL